MILLIYQILNFFHKQIRPMINGRYPKVPTQKIMTLMAAYLA